MVAVHAAAWEDKELLTTAAVRACPRGLWLIEEKLTVDLVACAMQGRLQRHGGSFSLSIRNPKELTKIKANWENFRETFTLVCSQPYHLISMGWRR